MTGGRDLWGVVVEGAVDRFVGRPLDRNPHDEPSAAHDAWEIGWLDADQLLETRGEAEARRWLAEAA